MRRRTILTAFALMLSVLVAVNSAAAADKKPKQGQLTGTVKMINKDKSTISVTKGNMERQIIYSADTKWAYGTQASAKPSSYGRPQGRLVPQLQGHV